MSAEVGREVSRRTLAGMRFALWLTVATIPLSFLTNTLLAHVSPLALGHYGAVMLFSAAFQSIAILGGPKLFTRFVPLLDPRDRVPFLFTYALLALSVFLGGVLLLRAVAPGVATGLLLRFGGPSMSLAISVAIAILVQAFLNFFLFGVLHGPGAAAVARFPVVGFFVAAVLGAGVFRRQLESDPALFLWIASLAVFGADALLAAGLALRTDEFRRSFRLRLLLPAGFWPALCFTHVETISAFAYSSLAPTFVLIWLDIAALAPFHGALRYVSLFEAPAALLAALLSPALAALDGSGLRDQAFRHAERALNATLILVVPSCLVLIFFAPDGMAIFGAQFRPSADLLRIASVAAVASPVVQFGGGMLVAFGEYRAYLAMSSIYIVAAVGLNFLLIPSFGVSGAAWAASIGALVQACAIAVVLRIRLGFRVPKRALLAAVVLVAAVAVALKLDPGRVWSAVLVATFALVFAGVARVTAAEIVGGLRTLAPGRSSKG